MFREFDLSEDTSSQRLGTRFLVFPQPRFIPGYEKPEPVWISTPRGRVGGGPSDHRLYVVDPLRPKEPYSAPYLPPFIGDVFPPAEPGPDGHFDELLPGTRQFLAAHAFASVRRVLDICESYMGQEVSWFFSDSYKRLEIIPLLDWDNSHSGYGFLELGEDSSRQEPYPFALNFDAIAHETGHLLLLGAIGVPRHSRLSVDFLAYHEAAADFISLLGLLHFDTALDHILRRTRGNLLISNELDRLAELSDEKQVRTLSHSLRIGDVGDEAHDRSRPFSGALFDTLVEIFQLILVERGLASLDTRTIREVRLDLRQEELDREAVQLREAYNASHFALKSALEEARDLVGEMFVGSWFYLDPDNFSFPMASEALVQAVSNRRGKRFTDRVYLNFAWRGLL
ncbi:hypothetical protein [Microvirga sp. TS319]|uniref:hypothetical protein n=1 Tax=Microvirga sp. TS319 TaxID=3241165 RepID=UPI00351A1C03